MEQNNVTKVKEQLLRDMHNMMLHMNDEDAYMHWITLGVPDEPSDDDFESIAEDEEEFNEVVNWWYKIYSYYSKYGMVD